jgi:nicotinate-nucleotide pyrophosphorylase (carboxylating)
MGEVDIIEGVDQQSVNTMAPYTSTGCAVENTTVFPGIQGNTSGQFAFSGQMTAMNCDVNAAGQGQNVGCSIQAPINPLSTSVASAGNLPGGSVLPTYGTNFNLADGGVYAMELTTESISIRFFPHTGAIPNDVTSNTPNPSGWGTRWPSSPGVAVTSRLALRT